MNRITNFKFVEPGEDLLTEDQAYFLRTFLDRTLKIGTEFEWNLRKGDQDGNCRGEALLCPCCNVKEREDGRKCIDICALENTCEIAKKGVCPGMFCFKFTSPCPTCEDWKVDCSKCKFAWDPSKDPQGVRNILSDELSPTGTAGQFGKCGVHAVKTDGSLDGGGGLEIPTVGRRVDYYAFLKQFRKIFKRVGQLGGYMNERASIHYHLLVSYGGNGSSGIPDKYSDMEEPIPGIYLRNFHQMFRVFHNPLIWISSAGNKWDGLTRWSQFRKSIMNVSGVKHKAAEIISMIRERYSMVHYRQCRMNDNKINVFHIEDRHCDGLNSPTAAAAMAMLLYGFAMKAADISMHGVLSLPSEFYVKQKALSEKLLNSGGDYQGSRCSNTRGVQEHAKDLAVFTGQMVDFVKVYLKKWPEVIRVLHSLAEKPCSVRLIEKQSWQEIEEDLYSIGKKKRHLQPSELEVLKLIDLCLICGQNPEEWVSRLSREVNKDKEKTNEAVKSLTTEGLISWSEEDQSYTRM